MSAVVPTLGRSPLLVPCLKALRRTAALAGGAADLEIVLVDQGPRPVELPAGLADRVLRPGRNLGFAGGTNRGLAVARGRLVALVNDDALVEPGWLPELAAALAAHPRAAAAQGVNLELRIAPPGAAGSPATAAQGANVGLQPDPPGGSGPSAAAVEGIDPPGSPGAAGPAAAVAQGVDLGLSLVARVDGWGLGWNRSWQAVQLGAGEPAPPASGAVREVFGVSATAALYRREALEAVALPGRQVFDERLGSYYEDVDLACRLRAAGFAALSVPAARARHAGSATGSTLGRARWAAIYGNRHLVLARHLGAAYWRRLPGMLARDARDLARAALAGDGSRLAGIVAGWGRAARHLPAYVRRGAPSLPLAELRRFRITSPP